MCIHSDIHTHTHIYTVTLKYVSSEVKCSLLPLTDKIIGHDDVTSK